jgi:hypothetical protein
MEGWVIIIGLIVLYFLPTLQAFTKGRRHPNANAIFALNLLLGWTVIGWVGALVWALTKPNPSPVIVNNLPAPPEDRRPCPYCAEAIAPEAKICRFCGKELPADWATPRIR